MSPRTLLDAYCEHFGRCRLEPAVALFAEQALLEFPLLGQRLVGRREIAAGLERIFEMTERAALELDAGQEDAHFAIVEGRLTAKLHRDAAPLDLPLAAVAQASEERLLRLSIYLDAHPFRPWSDGPLFARRESSAGSAP